MKKKIVFISSVLLLLSINFIITTKSNSSTNQIEFITQTEAFADINKSEKDYGDCYSSMEYYKGARTLECNTPCCYQKDLRGRTFTESYCTGNQMFTDC